jgi:UDP-glucose 4-epimerase
MQIKTILLTGGAGYIGSHTAISLINAGFLVIILDNLCNSKIGVISKIERIVKNKVTFINGDIRDRIKIKLILSQYSIDAVIHYAGLKAAGESLTNPLDYFGTNVAGTIILLEEMKKANVKKLVFSSSAAVYGDAVKMPITEDSPLRASNPYGRSKVIIEELLHDLYFSDPTWKIVILRYFNPVGAHRSGLIGEDALTAPTNLMPLIAKTAAGQNERLFIFGNDYPTADGFAIRDYIHIEDLIDGHIAAINYLDKVTGIKTLNLGTGKGCSVLNLIKTFERICHRNIPYKVVNRRPGDSAISYANPLLAKSTLGWEAKLGLDQMCEDAWRWYQHQNSSLSIKPIRIEANEKDFG